MLWCLLLLCSTLGHAKAERLTIAAAADLKFAMDSLITSFRADHSQAAINVIYGSSGRFFNQIQNGAPFDVYFSADIDYPEVLAKEGLTASPVHRYAIGRLVVWNKRISASSLSLASVKDTNVRRIAIANPKHAPYGKRAEEALRALDLWVGVEHKLVYGENIAQTAQFALTGNADIAVLALSLVLHPPLSEEGHYTLIPEHLHRPLEQGFVVTKRAEGNQLARSFEAFVQTPAALEILKRNGFSLPANEDRGERAQVNP